MASSVTGVQVVEKGRAVSKLVVVTVVGPVLPEWDRGGRDAAVQKAGGEGGKAGAGREGVSVALAEGYLGPRGSELVPRALQGSEVWPRPRLRESLVAERRQPGALVVGHSRPRGVVGSVVVGGPVFRGAKGSAVRDVAVAAKGGGEGSQAAGVNVGRKVKPELCKASPAVGGVKVSKGSSAKTRSHGA